MHAMTADHHPPRRASGGLELEVDESLRVRTEDPYEDDHSTDGGALRGAGPADPPRFRLHAGGERVRRNPDEERERGADREGSTHRPGGEQPFDHHPDRGERRRPEEDEAGRDEM